MDFLNGHDRKLGYLEEPDMKDFLDSNDIFQNPLTPCFPCPEDESSYEHDWLNSFLDDPVLNDRMMTDAMQPCIKSEHSYSINDHHNQPGSPLGLGSSNDEIDAHDFFTDTPALDLSMKSDTTTPLKTDQADLHSESFLVSTTRDTHVNAPTHSFLNTINPSHAISEDSSSSSHSHSSISPISGQSTIIVTTTASSPFLTGYPSVHIKQEPMDSLDHANEQTVNLDSILLPPTPPGSSGSDSDGSQSPPQAPSSPSRQNSTGFRHSATSPLGLAATKGLGSQPLFLNPISQSGVLILSEEEKRTLISEGYPIPTKVPLTKQEEKNLKKIRRKIKNKISAQESRRKKKEYLEALEKRVEACNHENSDLKKKVESLENNNRSLLGQLQKLQSLVTKMPKASATQTSTALMVMVFCFAVFVGSFSPSNLNIGYATKPAQVSFVQPAQGEAPPLPSQAMGPHLMTVEDTSDPYATPTLKSRMLMSLDQDDFCDDQLTMPWHHAMSCPMEEPTVEVLDHKEEQEDISAPGVELPLADSDLAQASDTTVVMMAPGLENRSDSTGRQQDGFTLPDISITAKNMGGQGYRQNFTADLETAA